MLAVFLCFIAASNSGEQVRRALFRAGGTAIGIVVGDLLVHLTGGHVWSSLLIVLVALFFGIYLIRVNYMFMTIGITVTMAQLYVQLDEFSWSLLLLRLAETAIGVAAVVVTVLLIVPLRPQRVLTTAVLLWFTALRALVDAVLDRGAGERAPLRPLIRDVDAAYAALVATATPLRRATFGRNSTQLTELLSVGSAARQYARSLAAGLQDAEDGPGEPSWAGNPSLRNAAGPAPELAWTPSSTGSGPASTAATSGRRRWSRSRLRRVASAALVAAARTAGPDPARRHPGPAGHRPADGRRRPRHRRRLRHRPPSRGPRSHGRHPGVSSPTAPELRRRRQRKNLLRNVTSGCVT